MDQRDSPHDAISPDSFSCEINAFLPQKANEQGSGMPSSRDKILIFTSAKNRDCSLLEAAHDCRLKKGGQRKTLPVKRERSSSGYDAAAASPRTGEDGSTSEAGRVSATTNANQDHLHPHVTAVVPEDSHHRRHRLRLLDPTQGPRGCQSGEGFTLYPLTPYGWGILGRIPRGDSFRSALWQIRCYGSLAACA